MVLYFLTSQLLLLEFKTIFSRPNQYHEYSLQGVGGQEDGGIGGKPKVDSFIDLNRKAAIIMFIEVDKKPQFTCQVDTVTDSSLTPVAPHTPQWTVKNLQDHRNDASERRPGNFQLSHWCAWIVQEYGIRVQAIILDFSSYETVPSICKSNHIRYKPATSSTLHVSDTR